MIATRPGITRVIQDVENTPSLACQRCGGILVDEHCMDIGDRFWGMRCIQCGDVIDETILRNRFSSIETLEKLRSRTKSRTIVHTMAG
jgi:hypothetical protein